MILTCELCQSQFLTEADPHVIIPGTETKIYCYCQVKGDDDQRWIDQLRHEHKLYHKHLSGLKAENDRLEAENAKLRQCVEFYADEANWFASKHFNKITTIQPQDYYWIDEYHSVGGKRARQCLKELEGK